MVIIIVIVFIVIIALGILLGKLQNRAMQTVLKDTPISDSAINGKMNDILAKKATKKFLETYGNVYTEDSIKDFLMKSTENIINRTQTNYFTDGLNEKISSDPHIDKIGQVQITKANLLSFAKNRFGAMVTVSNGRDEYLFNLYGTVNANGFDKIEKYTIQKGVAVGF